MLTNYPILALDFETFYGPKYSLSSMTTKDYVMDPRFKVHGCGVRWAHEGKETTRWISGHEAVKAFFDSIDWENTAVLCQNANFDAFILNHIFGIKPAFIYDTAAMGRMYEPRHKCGLDDMAGRYLGLAKDVDLIRTYGIRDLTPELDKVLGRYCIKDVDLMVAVFNYLLPFIPDDQLRIVDMAVRLHTEPKFILDVERITAFRDQEQLDAERKIADTGLPRSLFASNDKFAAHLKSIGVEIPMKMGKNGLIPALAKNDLQFHDLQDEHPELSDLWEARIAAKSRIGETRAQRFLDARMPDGTIPMPLKVAGAHTFRFSGFDSMNVQNMTRGSELRKSLKAPPGYVVCVIDLSQIEPRTNAWLSGQQEKLDLFRSGADIYAAFGTKLYGRPINRDVDIEEGQVAKVAELSLGYGAGWLKFARTMRAGAMGPKINISDEAAMNTVQVWRTENYMITRLWETCKEMLFRMMDRNAQPWAYGPLTITRERIELPSGLRLHYPDLRYVEGNFEYWVAKGKYWKKIYGAALDENLIQSLANVIIMEALLRAQPFLKEINGHFVLQVHDELVFLIPEKDAEANGAQLAKLIITNPHWCPTMPIKCGKPGIAPEYSK